MIDPTPQSEKVARCAYMGVQHATFAESGATSPATGAQQMGLKALSRLVLSRNQTRNSEATPVEKPRNFDPQKTGEKLHEVARVFGDSEAAILRWLHFIGENSQPVIDEVLTKCRTDPAALEYYLRRAQEVPQSGDHATADDRVTCDTCRHFQPNPINPAQGIGACTVGAGRTGPCLWPMARRWCGSHQERDPIGEPANHADKARNPNEHL
jgi:hypothetical protein